MEDINDLNYWREKLSELIKKQAKDLQKSRSIFEKSRKSSKYKNLKPLEGAPEHILSDENFMLYAIQEGFMSYFGVSENLKNSKDFAKRYFNEIHHSFFFVLPSVLQEDIELFKIALIKKEDTYKSVYFSNPLYKQIHQKDTIKELLQLNPKVYQYLSATNRKDLSISKLALALDISNIAHINVSMSTRIVKTPELANLVLKQSVLNINKLHKKLRDNEEFLIPWIQYRPSIFEYVSPRLKSKKDFVKYAADTYNFLDHIPLEFKSDTELMQLHINSNLASYADLEPYLNIRPLLLKRLHINHAGYEKYPSEYKRDSEFIYELLKYDTYYKDHRSNNILLILPQEIQAQLIEEYNVFHPDTKLWYVTQEEIPSLLKFARNKYSHLYLSSSLEEKSMTKKVKI